MRTERLQAALAWAVSRHAEQTRHNTGTPYVSHLLSTCALVIEEGGGEDLVIGALLHDALEDQPTSRDELRELFGDEVLRVVDACTDADFHERAGLGWRERKLSHVERMRTLPESHLLVVAADKVSSLQSLLDDLVRFGPAVFAHSTRSAEDLLWNYREILTVLRSRLPHRAVVHRLAVAVDAFALQRSA
jgi:(p)ppGpp synthase/HD superfamily hydrolase